MGIRIMFRRCEHCKHRYIYNPSVGRFEQICPKCGKVQLSLLEVIQKET